MADHQPFRLGQGGLIDRERAIGFSWNGKNFQGFEGDSLASALLANGERLIARSFKYHRPRGIYSAGDEEPSAIVETGRGGIRTPNCRAPLVPLRDGLEAHSQRGWPSLGFDLGRALDFTHALWPVGFYNKTFMWPSWHTWEGLIRRSSATGRPPTHPDPDRYERMNWHCDVLICGAGPAGLAAALIAGRSGLRVVLAEQDWEPGGALIREKTELNGRPARDWVGEVVRELEQRPEVLYLPRTTVTGIYDHRLTSLLQAGDGGVCRACYWTVRPRRIILATGAVEQGLVFPDNDRPGTMLAGAVRAYIHRYAVVPGHRAVVATNNDSAYQTALDLAGAGMEGVAVVDSRTEVGDELRQRLESTGVELLRGANISGTRGAGSVRRVRVEAAGGRSEWRDCDLLAASGGWAPRAHLLAHARGRLGFDTNTHSFRPTELPEHIHVAGSVTGAQALSATLDQGREIAAAVCISLGVSTAETVLPEVTRDTVCAFESTWQAPRSSRRRQWIDLAHDVTTADAELAVREGFESVEHFKRYTTAGMALDQGKTSNTNALLLLSGLTGKDPEDMVTTTFRPPYAPVTLGTIAAGNTGEMYAPRRYLPAHAEHLALGARFEDYGWQRPECYPRNGESAESAILREARAVRSALGVFDNSPIGKLEVRGPDAAVLLDRLYINDALNLAVGRARYGLMLNENGVIIDDSVFVRLAQDHYVVHTTSGGAQRIAEWMEEWLQCEWRDLEVIVHDATSQWACFTLAGPRAHEALAGLGCAGDLSKDALPHMATAGVSINGIEARILRASYSGEASYEISVPDRFGVALLRAMMAAGAPCGIEPFGIEALMILRTEKGLLHVGTDTDGSTSPDDVGWGHVARRKNRDFIGRRSLSRPANTATGRKQFVGLEPVDSAEQMTAGGHLLLGEGQTPPAETHGWVTSACYSPSLERHIGLGMLRDGRSHMGATVLVCDEARQYRARVVSPVFVDPENHRLS